MEGIKGRGALKKGTKQENEWEGFGLLAHFGSAAQWNLGAW